MGFHPAFSSNFKTSTWKILSSNSIKLSKITMQNKLLLTNFTGRNVIRCNYIHFNWNQQANIGYFSLDDWQWMKVSFLWMFLNAGWILTSYSMFVPFHTLWPGCSGRLSVSWYRKPEQREFCLQQRCLI